MLDPLQHSVSGATDRLRALLFDLEPPDLQHGLADALRRAADEIFESTAVRWSVTSDQEPESTDAIRAVAYRVVREALINVRKHAQAQHVEMRVGTRRRPRGRGRSTTASASAATRRWRLPVTAGC